MKKAMFYRKLPSLNQINDVAFEDARREFTIDETMRMTPEEYDRFTADILQDVPAFEDKGGGCGDRQRGGRFYARCGYRTGAGSCQ